MYLKEVELYYGEIRVYSVRLNDETRMFMVKLIGAVGPTRSGHIAVCRVIHYHLGS